MTKICIVGPSKKYFSGVSAHTIWLANALSETNEVSSLLIRNLLPRFLYPGNKNVGRQDYSVKFAPKIIVYDGMDWNSPLSWFKACRFLKKEKPDVIIMAWWTSAVAHMQLLLAAANALNPKAKLVLDMHEIADTIEANKVFLKSYSRAMGKLIMNRATAFVVHSQTVKNQAIKVYRLREDKVFVVPIGIYDCYSLGYPQAEAKKDLGINEEFVILYFGMIRKYKGVPCLVQAFDKLSKEAANDSRLIIAGEDWGDEKDLEPMIKASPYKNQITYHPEFVPDSAVAKYFSAADVIVLPYLRSAGSGVASLAMAFGKPIIITELEHTKEALKAYEGTILVPCGDSLRIAEKISDLYYQRKASKVKSYAVPDMCGWDNVTDLFNSILSKITVHSKPNIN